MIVTTFLTNLALRAGIAQRFAKAVGIAAGAAALISIFFIGKAIYDHRLIARHDDKVNATVERKAREAEHKADAVTNPITKQQAADQADRQEAIRNAAQDHPQEARRPVGPATSAALDRLRERQRKAGNAGR